MRATQLILAGAIALAARAEVRADLHVLSPEGKAPISTPKVALLPDGLPTPDAGRTADTDDRYADDLILKHARGGGWSWTGPATTGLSGNIRHGTAGQGGMADTAELHVPPLPGSARLFLGAMLSVGAWQVVRSARDARLGMLPEWYHSGAPAQIGYTVLCELHVNALPVCRFDGPAGTLAILDHWWPETRLRFKAQRFSISGDPRGPPAYLVL